MRTVDSPRPFAALGLGLEPPPVPVSAIINPGATQLVITFDRQLFPNPFPNLANWSVRWANFTRTVSSGNATGFTLTLNLVIGGADAGIDQVTFAPPPFDILDLVTLREVQAFTDFPVTL